MISKPLMCSENVGFHSSGFLRAITVIQLLMETATETVLTLSSSSFVCKNNHEVSTYLHREFLNAVGNWMMFGELSWFPGQCLGWEGR